MNVQELNATLEAYAHLRELPQYANLKTAIEQKLKAENDALKPVPVKPAPAPVEEPDPSEFEEPEVRR